MTKEEAEKEIDSWFLDEYKVFGFKKDDLPKVRVTFLYKKMVLNFMVLDLLDQISTEFKKSLYNLIPRIKNKK